VSEIGDCEDFHNDNDLGKAEEDHHSFGELEDGASENKKRGRSVDEDEKSSSHPEERLNKLVGNDDS